MSVVIGCLDPSLWPSSSKTVLSTAAALQWGLQGAGLASAKSSVQPGSWHGAQGMERGTWDSHEHPAQGVAENVSLDGISSCRKHSWCLLYIPAPHAAYPSKGALREQFFLSPGHLLFLAEELKPELEPRVQKMSLPLQAACCLCWDTVRSRPAVESAWQRDRFPAWASSQKPILKKINIYIKLDYRVKRSIAQLMNCLLSHCLCHCLRGDCFPSPHPGWNQQELRSSAFSGTSHCFPSLLPLLWQTLVWGTGSAISSVSSHTCVRFSAQMPDTVTFEKNFELLLNSLQRSLHLWLSSLNKLLSRTSYCDEFEGWFCF